MITTTNTALTLLKVAYEQVMGEWAPITMYKPYEVRRTGQVRNSATGKGLTGRMIKGTYKYKLSATAKGAVKITSFPNWVSALVLVKRAFPDHQPGMVMGSTLQAIINKARGLALVRGSGVSVAEVEAAVPDFRAWLRSQ